MLGCLFAEPDASQCGEWSAFGPCNVGAGGSVYKMRHRLLCPEVFELEQCEAETEAEGSEGCSVWGLWSACADGMQSRRCTHGVEVTESRVCSDSAVSEECGTPQAKKRFENRHMGEGWN